MIIKHKQENPTSTLGEDEALEMGMGKLCLWFGEESASCG